MKLAELASEVPRVHFLPTKLSHSGGDGGNRQKCNRVMKRFNCVVCVVRFCWGIPSRAVICQTLLFFYQNRFGGHVLPPSLTPFCFLFEEEDIDVFDCLAVS